MRLGRLELTLTPGEPGTPGRLRRRALTVVAVASLVGLPGAAAMSRMMSDDDGGEAAAEDEGWGATNFLDESAEDYVQANWERAMDIEPIYTEGIDIADEDMAPLVGALGVSGIPEIALDAYYNAEDTLAFDDPDCGVPWSLLAAIGRVESNHGRFGGAVLQADGYPSKPIRGVPLNGGPGVALIRDSDGGSLDDDTEFDRAVGPMQFIPSTWRNVAVDGNGDGDESPDNIFDATVGAGVYLCAGNGDLLFDAEARAAAIRRYNNSAEYVRTVLALADQYENGDVEPLPYDAELVGEGDLDDAAAAAAGELGPELPEPEDEPAPAPAPPPAVTVPQPAPPAAVPSLPDPVDTPGSVGWPSGMNELPPAELPPPVPLPTVPGAPSTTTPPTTLPADPGEVECPDDPAAPVSTTTTTSTTSTTTVPPSSTTSTLPPVADDQGPCAPPDDAAVAGSADTGSGTGAASDSAGASTPGSSGP